MNIESVLNGFSKRNDLQEILMNDLKNRFKNHIENFYSRQKHEDNDDNSTANKTPQPNTLASEEYNSLWNANLAHDTFPQSSSQNSSIKDLILNRPLKTLPVKQTSESYESRNDDEIVGEEDKRIKSNTICVNQSKQYNKHIQGPNTVYNLLNNYPEAIKESEMQSLGFDKNLCITSFNNRSKGPSCNTLGNSKKDYEPETSLKISFDQERSLKVNPNNDDASYKSDSLNKQNISIDLTPNIKTEKVTNPFENVQGIQNNLRNGEIQNCKNFEDQKIDEMTLEELINTDFKKVTNKKMMVDEDVFKHWKYSQKHFQEDLVSNEQSEISTSEKIENQPKAVSIRTNEDVLSSTSNDKSTTINLETNTLTDILKGKYSIPNCSHTNEIFSLKTLNAMSSSLEGKTTGSDAICRICNFKGW